MGTRFDLISDPIKTATAVSVYVVGDQWREEPYREMIFHGKKVALLVTGVNQKLMIGKAIRIYAKASNEDGEGPASSRKFTREVNTVSGFRYSQVAERTRW